METLELASARDRFKWYSRRYPTRIETYAKVIEDHVFYGMQFHNIAYKYKISIKEVCFIISLYDKKPDFELNLLSKV